MPVIDFQITSREQYADGRSFGEVGAYDRIEGRLRYAVDPEAEANRGIVDLQRAPRDGAGRVHFEGDVRLIVPADPERGNGTLLVDVPNRGNTLATGLFNRAQRGERLINPDPAGDGFLFERGFSVAAVGWQWDVPDLPPMLRFRAPEALDDSGRPLRGSVIAEIRPSAAAREWTLAQGLHRAYPAADLDEAGARLIMREFEDGPDVVIPRDRWRFATQTPEGERPIRDHVLLEDEFAPGKIYYLVYTTEGAPVVGTGLLAYRDAAAFFRSETASTPGFQRVIGYGRSQSGRFLRHLISLGLNLSEAGEAVFDGLHVDVAGGIRGEFNHRFAQPSMIFVAGFPHAFPFADGATTDPYSGQRDGLLVRCEERGVAPKIMYTNSSFEYWRGDGALLHIDPSGTTDLDEATGTRIYHFRGTQHMEGALPQVDTLPDSGFRAATGFNVVDYAPLERAALVNLDRWIRGEGEPPPSQYPRIADGTAVTRDAVLAQFTAIPGAPPLDLTRLQRVRAQVLGPDAGDGVAQYPVHEDEPYPALVPAVDDDGNEVAGIPMPDISVPVGTHTGWTGRHPEIGAPEQPSVWLGFSRWFAPTRRDRDADGDPRRGLEERYPHRDDYLARVRDAAEALAGEGYILASDLELVVNNCALRYDIAAAAASPAAAE